MKVTTVEPISVEISAAVLTRRKLLNEFFTDPGGSIDLNVDGSTTPVEYTIEPSSDRVRWINRVRFLFNDTNMELDTNDFRRFGTAATAPGLTNGLTFSVHQGGVETDFFKSPIVTVGDLMDYADDFTNFVNAISAQSDFLSFDFDFEQPVVLPVDSTDKLVVTINDDLTSIDLFKVIARGFQELA